MILWIKNGGSPQLLPLIDYDPSGDSWSDLANSPQGREACGWTAAPADATLPPALPMGPRQIAKVDFWRRFAPQEQVALLGAQKHIAEMPSADFALVENMGWWQLAVAFKTLDLIPQFVEPDHPDTITAVTAFASAGFITADRIPQILA